MTSKQETGPDSTAVRAALWRALHVEVDSPPYVFEDQIGLKLVAPDDGWRDRPDMQPFTRPFRASILARARFVEDVVAERVAHGVGQYVILGAGLDTFAQRRPALASGLTVFEIDQPGTQEWKCRRLVDLGFGIPSFLRFVPVNFEAGDSWSEQLIASGFDSRRPAVVASTGVSMYLTRDAIIATLRHVAALASGSILVMSFLLPLEMIDPEVRLESSGRQRVRARAAHPSAAISRRRRCSRWPAKPVSKTCSTCRLARSRNVTSKGARTVFGHRATRRSCLWRGRKPGAG